MTSDMLLVMALESPPPRLPSLFFPFSPFLRTKIWSEAAMSEANRERDWDEGVRIIAVVGGGGGGGGGG